MWVHGLRWLSSRCCGVSSSLLSTRCGILFHVFIPSHSLRLFSVSTPETDACLLCIPDSIHVGSGLGRVLSGGPNLTENCCHLIFFLHSIFLSEFALYAYSTQDGSAVGRVVSLDICADVVVHVVWCVVNIVRRGDGPVHSRCSSEMPMDAFFHQSTLPAAGSISGSFRTPSSVFDMY